MMTSDGSGMQADSMAISRTMPRYPVCEMTAMMNAARYSSMEEIIGGLKSVIQQNQSFMLGLLGNNIGVRWTVRCSECVGILSKDIAGQLHAVRGPFDLYAADIVVSPADFSEDSKRGEDLGVNLG